jgi:predicted nucleic acid-binding protein
MGLILDSSVLIAAERQDKNARQVLTALREHIGETEVGISVVTLIELAHGAARADTPQRRLKRQKFIEELISAMPVYPVTVAIALRAGQLDGENQAQGLKLALSDLLIGATVGDGLPSPPGARGCVPDPARSPHRTLRATLCRRGDQGQ